MMYWKLSIRNAKRMFINYLLYVVTMTVLFTIMEVSNCIAVMGKVADFQTISLPLLITVIQIILVGYIDTFMLRQRAKELANYLLLGMEKKRLTSLFLCELLLIGFFCFLTGTIIGFVLYRFIWFHILFQSISLQEMKVYRYTDYKSVFYTFCCFCLIEIINMFRLKRRLGKLQIRELMYEKNRSQSIKNKEGYKKWGILFFSSFACFIGFVCGIAFLPEDDMIYVISIVSIPLIVSIFAFYQWSFGYLYAHRRRKSVALYQKNRLYIMAVLTANVKTSAAVNAIFCICFLLSASSFIVGILMLQPEFQLFETTLQQWMGIAQISICLVFIVIYFSILALQQMIELRQDSKNNQILRYLGKSDSQIRTLLKQQIAIKLTLPMIMAFFVFFFCMPLLNRKMNLVLPVTMHNTIFQFAGMFFLCTLFFYIGYFFVVYAMSKQFLKSSVYS